MSVTLSTSVSRESIVSFYKLQIYIWLYLYFKTNLLGLDLKVLFHEFKNISRLMPCKFPISVIKASQQTSNIKVHDMRTQKRLS